jgi:SAM-dependent methyltransferase
VSAERRCELCGGGAWEVLYDVDGFEIARCQDCGLVSVHDGPVVPEKLIELYDASYWEDPGQAGYGSYESAEPRKRHHFRGLVGEIERIIDPGEMLEVGCAYGYFLDEARRSGWVVRGVEPSAHAARRARETLRLEVSNTRFGDMPVESESVDAIALWDVIEHLPDPRRTLETAHAWLRPGGVLALSTGDIESLSARIHGRDWSLLAPPWHQHFFSRGTLRRLLEDVGFRVVNLGGDGTVAVDPASEDPRVPRPLASVLRSRPVRTVARKLGAGMIMFVFARKESR